MTSLLIHSACVFYLTGLIWFAQLVQYPLLKVIDPNRYKEYYDVHINRVVWLILPVLILQLASGAFLFFDGTIPRGFSVLFLLFSFFVFVSTAYISLTIYKEMGFQYSEVLIDKLIRANWLRTAVWTVHGFLILVYSIFFLQYEFLGS